MTKNKIWIFGVLFGVLVSILPLEVIFPALITLICLSIGIILCILSSEEDNGFLISTFVIAFALRIIVCLVLQNLQFINKGEYFFGDGEAYSNNGVQILDLWRGGLTSFSAIVRTIGSGGSFSGTLSFYDFWNAGIYFFTGKSPFSVLFINCYCGALTLIIVYNLALTLNNRKCARIATLLTAFWPSMILWSIQNLKDSISIFLFAIIIWALVTLNFRFRFHKIFILMLASYAFMTFHITLFIIFVMVVYPISLLIPFWSRFKIIFIVSAVLLCVLVCMVAGAYKDEIMSLLGMFPFVVESESPLDLLYKLRMNRIEYSGSAFLAGFDIRNPLVLISFIPLGLLFAWFSPFPWQVGSFLQMMAMPEMLIYYFLVPYIFCGMKFILNYRMKQSCIIVICVNVLILALAFEGNVGTLFRHRAVILPIILLLAAIGLERKNFKIVYRT